MDYEYYLQRNIWLLIAMKSLRGLMLFMPTVVLFFQENGLSMTEVFLLQTFFSIAIVTIEIPSGYFADRYGRKHAIVIGSFLACVSFGIYAISYDFWSILLAEILLGIGFAFTSGADSALLYDSLAYTGNKSSYRRKESHMQAAYTLAEAVGSVIGGYLALVSLRVPLIAQALVTVFVIPLALMLREAKRSDDSTEHKLWTMRTAILEALYHNAFVRRLILFQAVITAAGLIVVWFRQSYFEALELPLALYGYVWAALMIAVTIGNAASDSVARFMGAWGSYAIVVALGAGGFLLLMSPSVLAIMVALGALALMRGLANPIITTEIQHAAPAQLRATILSTSSFVGRALFAALGPLAGWLSDAYSLEVAVMATGIVFLTSTLIILAFMYLSRPRLSQSAYL